MAYGGGSDGDGDGEIGSGDCCLESTNSMSDSLPNLFSKLYILLYKS